MTNDDLRAAAEAATPGPWYGTVNGRRPEAHITYIALASPDRILGICDREDAALALTTEHRLCGPKHEGCYSHWSHPHCRADGVEWPCDVEGIRAALEGKP